MSAEAFRAIKPQQDVSQLYRISGAVPNRRGAKRWLFMASEAFSSSK
jgi:hypothetical protein